MALSETEIGKLLDERFQKFASEQRTAAERERLLDKLQATATKNGLRENYEDDLRAHFSKRAENGENLEAKGVAEHVADYKSAKPNLFAKGSPVAKDAPLAGTEDSGTTRTRSDDKTDWRLTDAKDWRRKMSSWGIRV